MDTIFKFFGLGEPSAFMSEVTPLLLFGKLIGALAGSLISIAYILPRGRREAFLRLTVGLVTGLVFGGTAGVKIADMLGLLEKVPAFEIALMGAAIASLCAWWSLGVLQRLAEHLPLRLAGLLKTQNNKKESNS